MPSSNLPGPPFFGARPAINVQPVTSHFHGMYHDASHAAVPSSSCLLTQLNSYEAMPIPGRAGTTFALSGLAGSHLPAEPGRGLQGGLSLTPRKISVYQSLIMFLKKACPRNLGRSLSEREESARLWVKLDGYCDSMEFGDVVTGVVKSLHCRKTLLELSSELGLEDDSNLRDALRTDEEGIAALLISGLDSASTENDVLKLEGDPAQSFLDVVQEMLDKDVFVASGHRRKAHRIIRKLSEASDKLPSSLFITGVSGRGEHPTFRGGFGDIYRASYGDQTVALKCVRRYLHGQELRRLHREIHREALVWKQLHNPHILAFLGIDQESFPPTLCIVSPWMEHGTVLNYLQAHGRANVDKLLFEVAKGLEYLHSHNVVHGDLKGANILIDQDWRACLADFGLSGVSDATNHGTSNRAGSIYWMAPELINPEQFGKSGSVRTPASDVFAFGCLCIELYTGRAPFGELTGPAAILKIIQGERIGRPSGTPSMSDRLWRDVTAYWAQDPTARPLTQAVVEDMVWPPPERNYSTSPPLAPVQNPTHLRHNPIPFQQLRAFWESVKEPSRTLPQPRPLVGPPPKQNHSPPSPLSPTKDPSSIHIAHPQPQQQLTPSTYQSQQPSPAILTLAEHKERLLIAIRPLIEVQQLSRPDAVATLMKRLYDYGVADVDVETRLEILTKIRDSASSCYFRAWADNRTAADIMWRWLKQAFTVSHAEQGDQKEGTLLSETIMPLVQIIDRLPMTVESLKKSKLRKIVARLVKNPPSSEIKSTASNVERRWCEMVSEQCLESEKGADGT